MEIMDDLQDMQTKLLLEMGSIDKDTLTKLRALMADYANAEKSLNAIVAELKTTASTELAIYVNQLEKKSSEFMEEFHEHIKTWVNDYVTPEMFGAVGDGVTDDSDSFRRMNDYAYETKVEIKLSNKKYYVKGSHIFGAPKSFKETDYDRLTYNLNIDGGESIILWKPLTDADYFLYGQHLRHSNVKNLKIKVVSDRIQGSFLATNTNNSNNESHTFSCNLFENICVNGNLKNFLLFDSTGDKPTHDDLSTFINCSASCLIYYATNNGNSVNLVFTNCSYSSYGLETEESGSLVKIYTNSWGGGLTFHGCHITTKNNDIVINTQLSNRRRIALHDCRIEVYGNNVQLVNTTGGIIEFSNFECIPLTDDFEHEYFNITEYGTVHANNCTFLGTNAKIGGYASFEKCMFYVGRTIIDIVCGITNTFENAIPHHLHIDPPLLPRNDKTIVPLIYDNHYSVERITELKGIINGKYIVNKNAFYEVCAPITATFEYIHNGINDSATYALYVNDKLINRVTFSEKIEGVELHVNDTINFRFYSDNVSTSDVAETVLGVTSSTMIMRYTCN